MERLQRIWGTGRGDPRDRLHRWLQPVPRYQEHSLPLARPGALARGLLRPEDDLVHVRYFTARMRGTPGDPGAPLRQQVYLRALRTFPNLTIHWGHFLISEPYMPVKNPPPRFIQVIKTEEKGSDVNLATHLLTDGFLDSYDLALVVSNDSDLCPPLEMVRNQLHKQAGVANPHPGTPSKSLKKLASFYKPVRAGLLAASQFPESMVDAAGQFTRPAGW